LTSVTLPGSGGTVSFKYDPFGRRIYKSSSSGTSIYAYDGSNLIEETNGTGAVVARYTQTQNIDEPLAMLRSAATSYYHADGLGSVTSLSNAAGTLAQTYAYDSFGKQTSSSGSLTNPFRYAARESDTETGLYYYRARYYDPSVGKFLSEDPVEFDGGINFYNYVGNDPSGFVDPTGKQAQPAPITIPKPPLGPILVPDPVEGPGLGFCVRFPWICALGLALIPQPLNIGPDQQLENALLRHHSDQAKKKCNNNGCKPCVPPVGTIAYRLETAGDAHRNVPPPHWHLYVMQQNPTNCQCQWVDIKDNQGGFGAGTPPSGTVPISGPTGGGHP